MADKRDYYEVLGIEKGASEDEIKKRIEKTQKNTIRIFTPAIKRPRKSSRRLTKRTRFSQTKESARVMISTVTPA
jgi:hypothetical protein